MSTKGGVLAKKLFADYVFCARQAARNSRKFLKDALVVAGQAMILNLKRLFLVAHSRKTIGSRFWSLFTAGYAELGKGPSLIPSGKVG